MHGCLSLKSRGLRLKKAPLRQAGNLRGLTLISLKKKKKIDSPHITALKLDPLWPQQLVAQLWVCSPHCIYLLSLYNLRATTVPQLHSIISQSSQTGPVQSQMHHGVSKHLLGWRRFSDGHLADHWLSNYSASAQCSILWLVVQHLIPLLSDDHPTNHKNLLAM